MRYGSERQGEIVRALMAYLDDAKQPVVTTMPDRASKWNYLMSFNATIQEVALAIEEIEALEAEEDRKAGC